MSMTVEGIEYLTKEEAALRCFKFAEANPGSRFDNFAHSKHVRRATTAAEQQADVDAGNWKRLEVNIIEWNKIYIDSPILKTHPELRGMWRQKVVADAPPTSKACQINDHQDCQGGSCTCACHTAGTK